MNMAELEHAAAQASIRALNAIANGNGIGALLAMEDAYTKAALCMEGEDADDLRSAAQRVKEERMALQDRGLLANRRALRIAQQLAEAV